MFLIAGCFKSCVLYTASDKQINIAGMVETAVEMIYLLFSIEELPKHFESTVS